MFIRVIVVAVFIAAPWMAHAGNAQKKFNSLIAKFAVTEPFDFAKPSFRGACACTVALPAVPGFLVREMFDHKIYCAMPGFDSDGRLVAYGYCQQFVVLGK
ncbi:MAG: hypothetical protein IT293_10425 [Deltaproteobacteria bacterium]|nr:hypothetical protein [Deltaproteobacteria bacterium]